MASFVEIVGTSIQVVAGLAMIYGFFKSSAEDSQQSMKGIRAILFSIYMLLAGLLASTLTIIER